MVFLYLDFLQKNFRQLCNDDFKFLNALPIFVASDLCTWRLDGALCSKYQHSIYPCTILQQPCSRTISFFLAGSLNGLSNIKKFAKTTSHIRCQNWLPTVQWTHQSRKLHQNLDLLQLANFHAFVHKRPLAYKPYIRFFPQKVTTLTALPWYVDQKWS